MIKIGGTLAENMERDIGKILQKLEDQDKWLVNIDKKLSYTNGKIAKTMQNLALVTEKQESCPARVSHGTPFQSKNILLGVGMFIIAILNLYLIIKIN